jgi:hypothetical protein
MLCAADTAAQWQETDDRFHRAGMAGALAAVAAGTFS